MAFSNHPDAYWDAGLSGLGFVDLTHIANTLDGEDFKDTATWKQVGDIMLRYADEIISE